MGRLMLYSVFQYNNNFTPHIQLTGTKFIPLLMLFDLRIICMHACMLSHFSCVQLSVTPKKGL